MAEGALGNLLENLPEKVKEPDHVPLVKTDHFRSMRIIIPKGVEIPPHPEPAGTLFIVLKGKGIFHVNGKETELEPMDSFYIPPEGIRGITCIEDLTILGIQDQL